MRFKVKKDIPKWAHQERNCKGASVLGTACGKCPRCKREKSEEFIKNL